jgi:hypothetical protein
MDTIRQYGSVDFIIYPEHDATYPDISVFHTTKSGGISTGKYATLNTAYHVGDRDENVYQNRKRISKAVNIEPHRMIYPRQIHTNNVKVVDNNCILQQTNSIESDSFSDTDALITDVKDVVLVVQTADCLPVMFFDPVRKVTGIAHAGWRGLINRIIPESIKALQKNYDVDLKDLHVISGPAIKKESYQVGEDVYDVFKEEYPGKASGFFFYASETGKYKLSLHECLMHQLKSEGIQEQNILMNLRDTFKDEVLYSARRDGLHSGRFVSGIMIR